MSEPLPARASLAWLRKTAKQQLRTMRGHGRDIKLAEAQFALARQYGFSSWRALKADVERLQMVRTRRLVFAGGIYIPPSKGPD
jgi:hypothetical protein